MKTQIEIGQFAKEQYLKRIDDFQTNDFSDGVFVGYQKAIEDFMLQDQIVTRFEVIDETGRVYSKKNCKIELSYQDDGKTLKVFIKGQ